jgi:hypothetical protein
MTNKETVDSATQRHAWTVSFLSAQALSGYGRLHGNSARTRRAAAI